MLPTPVLNGNSPYFKLLKSVPDYQFLRVFGFMCFPWLRPYVSNKLQPRSTKRFFLSYSATSKGYRYYDCKTGRFFICRHVLFMEEKFSFSQSDDQQVKELLMPVLGFDPHSFFPQESTKEQGSLHIKMVREL